MLGFHGSVLIHLLDRVLQKAEPLGQPVLRIVRALGQVERYLRRVDVLLQVLQVLGEPVTGVSHVLRRQVPVEGGVDLRQYSKEAVILLGDGLFDGIDYLRFNRDRFWLVLASLWPADLSLSRPGP